VCNECVLSVLQVCYRRVTGVLQACVCMCVCEKVLFAISVSYVISAILGDICINDVESYLKIYEYKPCQLSRPL
jgi:hypothetical protein